MDYWTLEIVFYNLFYNKNKTPELIDFEKTARFYLEKTGYRLPQ